MRYLSEEMAPNRDMWEDEYAKYYKITRRRMVQLESKATAAAAQRRGGIVYAVFSTRPQLWMCDVMLEDSAPQSDVSIVNIDATEPEDGDPNDPLSDAFVFVARDWRYDEYPARYVHVDDDTRTMPVERYDALTEDDEFVDDYYYEPAEY